MPKTRTHRRPPAGRHYAGRPSDQQDFVGTMPAHQASLPEDPPSGDVTGSRGASGSLPVVLVAVLSTLVVVGVVLVGPFERRATLAFSVAVEPGQADGLLPYRAELMETCWQILDGMEQQAGHRWEVSEDPAARTLSVGLVVDDRRLGAALLTQLSAAYAARLQDAADAARMRKTDGERLLEDRLTQLRGRLSRAMRGDQDARIGEDPSLRRADDRKLLASHRSKYTATRQRLAATVHQLRQLEATPLPEHPPVDPAQRRRVYGSHVELQQDLAELRVRLASMQAELLDVWQSASPALTELLETVRQLAQAADGVETASGPQRVALERAVEAGADYQHLAAAFAESWGRDFDELSQTEVDPAVARVLDAQGRIGNQLGDFLFESTTLLVTVRDQVRILADLTENQARHHVVTTSLTRAYHALQNAHQQFEFVAVNVRTANNFRLGAAAKAAEGLRRRVLNRDREINQQLQAQARVSAAEQRGREIAGLKTQIAELRDAVDQQLDTVFEIQDRVDRAGPDVEEYVRQEATAAATTQRLAELAAEIAQTETRLAQATAQREVPVDPQCVRVMRSEIEPTPINLKQRFAYAWAAGVTTCLGLLLAQRLLRPRRRGR